MKAQTVNQLLQLLVNGPILLRQSTRAKNKYFKVALGAAGTVVIFMALNEILKTRQAQAPKPLRFQRQNKVIRKTVKPSAGRLIETINYTR